jgi:murein DD-endopeptidase MepM/ murein hydrolase activator NlpD
MMSNDIPKPEQYTRFGTKFEEPETTTMTGRVKGLPGSAEGTNIKVQGFSAGNLSGELYQGKLNSNLIDAGSDPDVRAYVQAILPPVLTVHPNGIITVEGTRITSGQGIREGGAAGTLEHKGIDLNKDSRGSGAIIHSPVNGEVMAAGRGKTNTIRINDGKGYAHDFLHSNDIKVTIGQKIEAGDELSKVSNFYENIKIAPHLHYQISKIIEHTNPKTNIVIQTFEPISVEEYAMAHPLEARIQDAKTLPDGAGTLKLEVGQLNLETAGKQNLIFDLNATNVSHIRFDLQDREFSYCAGNGLVVRVNSDAKPDGLGGQVVTPEGVGIPFIHNGLKTYDDGSLMLTQPDGSIRSIEPSTNPKTGQFEWQDRVMTRSQAIAEFGADVELPPAPPTPTILPSLSPSTQTPSPAIANPSSSTKDTSNDSVSPARGSGEVWFGSDAGSAMQQQQAPHIRPPGGYPMPTEAQFASNEPIRLYNQQDGTSKLYTFNSDGVPIREQQLDVNGVDINQKISPERSQQMNVAQEQSQQPQTKLSISL